MEKSLIRTFSEAWLRTWGPFYERMNLAVNICREEGFVLTEKDITRCVGALMDVAADEIWRARLITSTIDERGRGNV